MSNPRKVEVYLKEHCDSADDGPFDDASSVEYLLAHVQHIHTHDLDPVEEVRASSINILRTVQLLSGLLAVVLRKLATEDTALATALIDEIFQQLQHFIIASPSAFVGVESPSVGAASINALDTLDEEQLQLLEVLAANPIYRGRH